MGTNYYRRRIATETEKNDIKSLIDKNLIEEAALMINNINQEIHICKCSYGWKTLWDHNWCEYYDMSESSLKKFLSEPYTYIVDEYGKKYSFEEFWNMIKERDSNPNNNFTSKTYDEYEKSQGKLHYQHYQLNRCNESYRAEFRMRLGLDSEYSDYITDEGLRFAIFTDFF